MEENSEVPIFNIGNWVEWDTEKGIISAKCIAIVPPGFDFATACDEARIPVFRYQRRDRNNKKRGHVSYLLASERGPRGRKAPLYWPDVKKLRRVIRGA